MKRTEIHEVYYGSHTDAQVKDAMNAAILSAVGIAVPKPTPPTPPQRRTARVMPQEWHERLRDAHEAHRRSGAASQRVVEHRAAENVFGVDLKPVQDIAAREIQREEQSFTWREPISVEEFLSGADGRYRSPYREQ